MEAGTWAEWITGFATFAAVGVAVWAFTDERRRHRRASRELAAEALRDQVANVVAYVSPDYVELADALRPDRPARSVAGWSLVIRNYSIYPLLRWRAEVMDQTTDSPLEEKCWIDSGLIPPMEGGEEQRLGLPDDFGKHLASTETVLTFEDGAGNHWRRGAGTLEKLSAPPKYHCGRSDCESAGNAA